MSDEKATESIMVRIGKADKLRVDETAKRVGLTPTALARMGLFEAVARIEANQPKLHPADASRLARLRAIEELPGVSIDVDAELEAMRDRILQRQCIPKLLPTGSEG